MSNFTAYKIQEHDISSGIKWCHPTDNSTMYIKKNGVEIELTPEEIKQVVYAAGGNFKR